MGVKGTMEIGRADAIREIQNFALQANDQDLSRALEFLLGEKARFLNFRIVPGTPEPEGDFLNRVYRRGMFDD